MDSPMETRCPPSFVSGAIDGVICKKIKAFADQRGWLSEIYRTDELSAEFHPAMSYLSETRPGVARGPHEHRFQTDYFAFLGPGEFDLYLWDIRPGSPTYGIFMKISAGQSNPSAVLIPPGIVHAYKNVSELPGWVLNFPNRLYGGENRKEPVDEIRHEDDPKSLFSLD
jgi:dTDP-4-dehydrorhamnose 3,5-epimerase